LPDARDVLDTKVAIRDGLETLAARHGISHKEVNRAMQDYAGDMLSDLVFEIERELTREIEERDAQA
jgi:hypothetical protein